MTADKQSEIIKKAALLSRELESLEARARAARCEIVALYGKLHDVAIGDTVETPKGERFIVTRVHDPVFIVSSYIEGSLRHRPQLSGAKIRKDGTPSTVSISIWTDWKKVG